MKTVVPNKKKVSDFPKRVSLEPPVTPPVDTQAQQLHHKNQEEEKRQQSTKEAVKNFKQTTNNKFAHPEEEKEEFETINVLLSQPLKQLERTLNPC